MAVQVKSSSPLKFGQFTLAEGVEFWDVVDLPAIPEQTDDVRYIVTAIDRVDTLAYRFYQDHRLWWVIAVANDLEILPTDLIPGEEIRIPSPRFVTQNLLTGTARRVS